MRILLLGANGQLGRAFVEQGGLARRGQLRVASRDGKLVTGGSGEIADLATLETLPALLNRLQPQWIINAAGYTAVDRAEQEEALATRINGAAVGVLGDWAAQHDALVVHYSSDYVFDGKATTPYPVNACTGPLGAYGRSKLAGELALQQSGADHLIFRTAWVYAAHGHNFLQSMLHLGTEREELRIVADQYGSPTSTELIVRGTLAALDAWAGATPAKRRTDFHGIHHLVASGHTSWQGFALAIFDQAAKQRLTKRIPRITPIATTEFPTLAERPRWSVLDNIEFQQRFEFELPSWQVGLQDIIAVLSTRSLRS